MGGQAGSGLLAAQAAVLAREVVMAMAMAMAILTLLFLIIFYVKKQTIIYTHTHIRGESVILSEIRFYFDVIRFCYIFKNDLHDFYYEFYTICNTILYDYYTKR